MDLNELLQRIMRAAPTLIRLTAEERAALKAHLSVSVPIRMSRLQQDEAYRKEYLHNKDVRNDYLKVLRFNEEMAVIEPSGKDNTPRAKRGRKPDTDQKEDARIAAMHETGNYTSIAALADELGMTKRVVVRALDRHRKRKERRN